MVKMKIGDSEFEGTETEIKDLFENNGLVLEQYIKKPRKALSKIWLIIPCILLFVSIVISVFQTYDSLNVKLFLVVIMIFICIWLALAYKAFDAEFDFVWSFIILGAIISLMANGIIPVEKLPEIITTLKPN